MNPIAPENNHAAHYGIIDPDYARVFTMARCLAWSEGYALMMHGSFTRDLDLLAVPWAERVCEPQHLINRIVQATGLMLHHAGATQKPHGRISYTLLFKAFGDPRFIDIGVMSYPPIVSLSDEEIAQLAKPFKQFDSHFYFKDFDILGFARALLKKAGQS